MIAMRFRTATIVALAGLGLAVPVMAAAEPVATSVLSHAVARGDILAATDFEAVSYTHLTLPTTTRV